MIAVDSSTLVAFFAGDVGPDTDRLDQALALQQAVSTHAGLDLL